MPSVQALSNRVTNKASMHQQAIPQPHPPQHAQDPQKPPKHHLLVSVFVKNKDKHIHPEKAKIAEQPHQFDKYIHRESLPPSGNTSRTCQQPENVHPSSVRNGLQKALAAPKQLCCADSSALKQSLFFTCFLQIEPSHRIPNMPSNDIEPGAWVTRLSIFPAHSEPAGGVRLKVKLLSHHLKMVSGADRLSGRIWGRPQPLECCGTSLVRMRGARDALTPWGVSASKI